jgi:uncharacterized protein
MSTNPESAYGWNSRLTVSLLEKLKADLKAAMMARDTTGRDAIRQIMSEFPSLTVPLTLENGKKTSRPKKPEEITDDDILDIIRKLVKSEKTVLEIKEEAGSDYLLILETYLPKMASAEEIRSWIDANVDFAAFKSPMQAMGQIMKHFGKLADGNRVKAVLQEINRA